MPIRKTYWGLYDLLSNKATRFSKNIRPFQKNSLKWPRISVANISVLNLEEWFLQLVKLSIVPVKLVYKSLLLLTCCAVLASARAWTYSNISFPISPKKGLAVVLNNQANSEAIPTHDKCSHVMIHYFHT